MMDLHYAPTPNGWKISIMLEELGASLCGRARQHSGWRAIQARISGDQLE
jgi:glutathione S-transferase